MADIASGFLKQKDEKKAGEIIDEAIKTTGEIKQVHNRDFARAEIAIKLAAMGKTGKALEIMDTIKSEPEKAQVYTKLAEKFADQGKINESLDMISHLNNPREIVLGLIYLAGKNPPGDHKINEKGQAVLHELIKQLNL